MSPRASTPAGRRAKAPRRFAPTSRRSSTNGATKRGAGAPRKRVGKTARNGAGVAPKRARKPARNGAGAPPKGAPKVARNGTAATPKRPAKTHRWGSWRRRAVGLVLLLAALAGAYQFWFRDSSLVAVQDVKVEGVRTADRDQIVASLTDAAKQMSTLDAHPELLTAAIRPFPTVRSVTTDPSFPHGMTIHVIQREPALVVTDGDRSMAVAADGTLLPGLEIPDELPTIPVSSIPASGELTGAPLQEALVIGAVPKPLRPLVERTTVSESYGVVVVMRGGIEVRFGSGSRAASKWRAASAVLADPELTSLTYLDVRVPERPAVGGAPATQG